MKQVVKVLLAISVVVTGSTSFSQASKNVDLKKLARAVGKDPLFRGLVKAIEKNGRAKADWPKKWGTYSCGSGDPEVTLNDSGDLVVNLMCGLNCGWLDMASIEGTFAVSDDGKKIEYVDIHRMEGPHRAGDLDSCKPD